MSSDMFLTPSNPSSALLSVFWNISAAEETPKLKQEKELHIKQSQM
jgi:hypothetical protein